MAKSPQESREELSMEMRFTRVQADLFKALQQALRNFSHGRSEGFILLSIFFDNSHFGNPKILDFASDGNWHARGGKINNTLESILQAVALFNPDYEDIVMSYRERGENYEQAIEKSKNYCKEHYHELLSELIDRMEKALIKLQEENTAYRSTR